MAACVRIPSVPRGGVVRMPWLSLEATQLPWLECLPVGVRRPGAKDFPLRAGGMWPPVTITG